MGPKPWGWFPKIDAKWENPNHHFQVNHNCKQLEIEQKKHENIIIVKKIRDPNPWGWFPNLA